MTTAHQILILDFYKKTKELIKIGEEEHTETPPPVEVAPKSGDGDSTPPTETPTPPTKPAVTQKADDRMAQATAIVARQEAATLALKEQLDRQEALQVEQTLGGKTDAGTTIKVEMTDEEYAKKALANDIEPKKE